MANAPEAPDPSPALARVVQRNIQALLDVRRETEAQQSRKERIAARVTGFTGSMLSVYLHAALFGGWIVLNTGVVPGVRPFDPFPFVMLAMFASVEAIFLSTFVLMTQNRMQAMADQRADLDLQVNLLAEHEITRLIGMTEAVQRHLGVEVEGEAEVEELKRDVAPEAVLKEISRIEKR